MGSTIREWWRARVPGLVVGLSLGALLGVLGVAGEAFGWTGTIMHGGLGTQGGPLNQLWASLSFAERLLTITVIPALLGLLSPPAPRTQIVYAAIVGVASGLRRARRSHNSFLD